MSYRVPFNRPAFLGQEFEYAKQALKEGHISGNGEFTKRCNRLLETLTESHRSLMTTSCTHALEMAAILLDTDHGHEVIVPSFTFTSTATAFALRGAKIVFADIREDTLNIDDQKLEGLITPKTRAIVPVHYAGVGCEMNQISALGRDYGIAIVEDNAHGLFGRYRNRPLGSFGTFSAQSFHETKNFNCGEGGALLINDPSFIERAEIIQEKGTNRSQFFRGEVDKYTWMDQGSNYTPSELLAAILFGQLEQREQIKQRREAVWQRYQAELRSWAERWEVRQPHVPEHCQSAYHIYYLVMSNTNDRAALLNHLKQRGIYATFHYVPLHSSPMGRRVGVAPESCSVSESISQRLLRLPLYNTMSSDEQEQVIQAVTDFSPA